MPVADSLGLIQIGVLQTFDLAVNDTALCTNPEYTLVTGSEVNVSGVSIDINTGVATFTVIANGPFTFNYERTCNSISEGIVVVNGTGFNCDPVIITTEPQSINVCNVSQALLSVTANGSDLQYQWRVNGNNIISANSSTYLAIASGVYSVEVYNVCSSDISADAIVAFNTSITGSQAFPPILQNVGVSYYKTGQIIGTPPFAINTVYKDAWLNCRLVGNFFEVYGTPTNSDVNSAEYHFKISNVCGSIDVFSFGGKVVKPCLKPIKARYVGNDIIIKEGETIQTVEVLGSTPFTYLHTTTGEIIGDNNSPTVKIKDTGCTLTLTTVITNSCGNYTLTKTFKTKREKEYTHPLEFECFLTPYSIKVVGDNIERFVGYMKNSLTFIAAFGVNRYEVIFQNKFGNIVKKYIENIEG